ncbi:hypothetical protein UFOVP136_5 [uncultured Caudovirales phage]|uniref:Uncharacterized protein n=1 Tax=uncultured Caudovirales phage TaxID=2100421 RepID=A0A6J5LBW8_9CAUD|nr:hypothetical protein UFOVP136_5 [uncultured Caudovirales phage]
MTAYKKRQKMIIFKIFSDYNDIQQNINLFETEYIEIICEKPNVTLRMTAEAFLESWCVCGKCFEFFELKSQF